MWIKTYGEKLLNLNSVCLIEITSPVTLQSGELWHVEAFLNTESDVSVTLFVGTYEKCQQYIEVMQEVVQSICIEL